MLSREIMGKGELKSTFLIESIDKRNMGTGFCLHQDEEGAYLVTCSHVVEACGVESLVVDTLEAKLLHQNLVIFGGQKLIAMKYNDGIHSYFNTFDQKMIPSPSFEEWRAKFDYVTPQIYREVVGVTGGYAKLTEQCFKSDVKNEEEAKILIDESTWKSDLFMAYKEYELCERFVKKSLGNAHPYSDNKLFYKLYWDNLIVEKKGKFVWRSAFLVEMGREVLGCV
jgi:hypothetical protein